VDRPDAVKMKFMCGQAGCGEDGIYMWTGRMRLKTKFWYGQAGCGEDIFNIAEGLHHMVKLTGSLEEIRALRPEDIEMMYELMDTFYDNRRGKIF
jgi:pyridoxal biosynthesis lyase PdxS